MTLTFSKTLLATAIMLGLTACGSGGGGGSSQAPTTSNQNNAASITVPNVDTDNSNTANNNTSNSTSPNTTIQVPQITPSTFKVGSDGYATGKATYASAYSTIKLVADFDNRSISGSAVGKIDGQNVNINLHNTTLYKGTSIYKPTGNYSRYDKIYTFKGDASAIHNQENFSGEYSGRIWGESSPFSEMIAGYTVTSEKDSNRTIEEDPYKGRYNGVDLYRQ